MYEKPHELNSTIKKEVKWVFVCVGREDTGCLGVGKASLTVVSLCNVHQERT